MQTRALGAPSGNPTRRVVPGRFGRRRGVAVGDETTGVGDLVLPYVQLLQAQFRALQSGWGLTREVDEHGARSILSSPGHTGGVTDRNVLGGELELCGTDPLTGFYRDGCCNTGPEDRGSHTICAVVTAEFLEHQRRIGNDLSTPRPQYRFPGLVPGDRWCVTAVNWLRAHEDGAAAYVVLASTHERALEIVPLAALQQHAVDVPGDPSVFGS